MEQVGSLVVKWTLEELRNATQKPIGDPAPARPELTVHIIDDDGHRLLIVLDAGKQGGPVERWQLTLASMEGDLTRMPLEDAALVLRANLEEWWDTRDQYSDGMPGVVARRISS